MIIENLKDDGCVMVNKINYGDCFEYPLDFPALFMKTDWRENNMVGVIGLRCGNFVKFDETTLVKPVDAKVVLT